MKAGKVASTGKGRIGESEVMLVKPRTWMNNSGLAVAPLMQREHLPIDRVIIIYDERVIQDVDELRFHVGDPELFFIFQVWDFGMDNPTINWGTSGPADPER